MAKKTAPLLPSTDELLLRFGDRLRMARLRRQLTAKQVAERAGMAPMTLRSLERGGAGVTMGAYLAVMQVLGIEKDIDLLAKADPLGRELQDARLPSTARKLGGSEPMSAKAVASPTRVAPAGTAEQLQRLVENLPQEQLRRAFESLPGEQLRRAVAALPTKQLSAALSTLDEPADALKTLRKSTARTQDWVNQGGFANAETLAGLLAPAQTPPKRRR